jgi:hypothetical protein
MALQQRGPAPAHFMVDLDAVDPCSRHPVIALSVGVEAAPVAAVPPRPALAASPQSCPVSPH